jgi:hypothetical protein
VRWNPVVFDACLLVRVILQEYAPCNNNISRNRWSVISNIWEAEVMLTLLFIVYSGSTLLL